MAEEQEQHQEQCQSDQQPGEVGTAGKVLGFKVLGFKVLGFKVLGFKVLGFNVQPGVED